MKKCIIITTINDINENIIKFSNFKDHDLIIVGDVKTPKTYENFNCIFLDLNKQKDQFTDLYDLLPFNHYCRKNLGYLYAVKNNYDIILESDDDNFPYDNFIEIPTADYIINKPEFVNIYKLFTDKKIWCRGLPLIEINNQENIEITETSELASIWNGLVDNNPDVDAIYRLVFNDNLNFNKTNKTYLIGDNSLSPFNTQNTIWTNKNIFHLMYLPCLVDFRFTDILRGYIAQICMRNNNAKLGFRDSTVKQIRNNHSLMLDFKDEIFMYSNLDEMIKIIKDVVLTSNNMDIYYLYEKLSKYNFINKKELKILKIWMEYF